MIEEISKIGNGVMIDNVWTWFTDLGYKGSVSVRNPDSGNSNASGMFTSKANTPDDDIFIHEALYEMDPDHQAGGRQGSTRLGERGVPRRDRGDFVRRSPRRHPGKAGRRHTRRPRPPQGSHGARIRGRGEVRIQARRPDIGIKKLWGGE